MADVITEGTAPAADADGTPTPKPGTSGAPEPKAADTGAADDVRDAEGTDEGTDNGDEGATEGEKAPAPKPDDAPEPEPENTDGDDSDDGDDLDEDDDRLDAKVRRRIREKNRENKRLRDRATTAERSLMAYRVADRSGLPLSVADRLKGNTEDELAADAADLLALMGRKARVSPTDLPDDGRRSGADNGGGVNFDDLAAKLYNR